MASPLVKWQLKKTGARLRGLRAELQVIDEQRMYLTDDADDLSVRAVVSESPLARSEAREAGGHAAAMNRHRAHVRAEIARLEAHQDELLDRLAPR
ncbi:MAG: hypothetical protein Q7V88_09430 [Actinomycetota bacterium]|nr:hypothetical protein [Actinomycetota bacterium]